MVRRTQTSDWLPTLPFWWLCVSSSFDQNILAAEISPFGLHWPDLDEDLSFRGILLGDHGQCQKVEPLSSPRGQ